MNTKWMWRMLVSSVMVNWRSWGNNFAQYLRNCILLDNESIMYQVSSNNTIGQIHCAYLLKKVWWFIVFYLIFNLTFLPSVHIKCFKASAPPSHCFSVVLSADKWLELGINSFILWLLSLKKSDTLMKWTLEGIRDSHRGGAEVIIVNQTQEERGIDSRRKDRI